ncbi:sugar phosphate isomerase/epimerase family protein [Neolewinella persica]|uniref:sugar phosphate isomerase/epimerase family protein n=1 Tax=Neolewinella persica TaxID=70998 RepID=UPI0003743F8B|nr:TIM barrel protein [Neolewinella persica]
MQRRTFLRKSTAAGLSLGLLGTTGLLSCGSGSKTTAEDTTEKADMAETAVTPLWFDISLAQWSLHRTLRAGDMDNLDFAKTAKMDFGISGVEYVNQFFKDKATNMDYLKQMNQRADDHGVTSVLIMCDGEGQLGDTDTKGRMKAVENHHKWVDAAKFLGCHSIRVNAAGKGTAEEVAAAATEGLGKLSEYAKTVGINVIVENHGGYSSNGKWLSGVIAATGMDNCGTLPDFGNFCIERSPDGCKEMYDRYQGVAELMPFAKAVSAKSHNFDADGWETESDYKRILKTVKDAGYTGWIGVEYEGSDLSEAEGIRKTVELLKMAGAAV